MKTYTIFFFYTNLFYKNVEVEINQNFKNVLRVHYPIYARARARC